MYRLTKQQHKDRDRITAWLEGKPFRDNGREAVPELTVEQVLEMYMPTWDPQENGQFFTPLEMGAALVDLLNILPGSRVLEPSAGIGHLVFHLQDEPITVDCFEADQTCVAVGQRLFPWANWKHATPFEELANIEGQYDFVLANPPFETDWAIQEGLDMSAGKARKSQHLFMEVIARALKVDGQAAVIGPPELLNSMPQALRAWFEARMDLNDVVELPGEFRLTKARVVAFLFTRLEYEEEAVAVAVPVMPAGKEFGAIVSREILNVALDRVGLAIANSAHLPVLRNVLVRAVGGDRLELVGTNLAVRVTTWVEAEQVRAGEITLPWRPFSELCKRVPGQYVTLVQGDEPDEAGMVLDLHTARLLSHGKFTNRARLQGILAEDFPIRPVVEGKEFEVDGPKLSAMLNQVKHYISSDKTRPVLQGVLFRIKDGQASMTATNGFSLALTRDKVAQEDVQVVIPWMTLAAARRLWGAHRVKITLANKFVRFSVPNVEIIGYIEHNTYPDYSQVIPKMAATVALVDRGDLLRAVRRMRVYTRWGDGYINFRFSGNGDGSGRVRLTTSAAFAGDCEEELKAVVEGPAVELAFGGKQIAAALYASKADEAEIKLNGSQDPVTIQMGSVLQVLAPRRDA
ncbi:MAG: hypothetical protein KJ077_11110 [Anaerolineae bacterium]|nr:hypothetical protein [Anaerolineae bacterium]